MYEPKERQKFISDAQYLREMQHKKDSEYRACLKKQEQAKEQSEKKREQHPRQELRQTSVSSVSAVRSYEKPWISRLSVNKTSPDDTYGSEVKPGLRSLANKSEAKFPAIEKTPVKQKQKTSSKKSEKNGPCSKKDPSAFQKPILSRRQRMNQKILLENAESENVKRMEGKGRKTPVLQGIGKITRVSDAQDVTGQRSGSVLKIKKKSQEKKNLVQASKHSISDKSLEKDLRKGNVSTATQQAPTNSADPPVRVANSTSISSESSYSSLPPITSTPTRAREDYFYAMLSSNGGGPGEENEGNKDVNPLKEECLSADLGNPPSCDQSNRVNDACQAEQYNCEAELRIDGRRADLPYRLQRQYNVAVDQAANPPAVGQRKANPRPLGEKPLEEDRSDGGEELAFSAKRPGSATTDETRGHLNSAEDWQGNNMHSRERQGFESNRRSYGGHIGAARPVGQRSAFNIPASLVQPANRAEAAGNLDAAAASVQVTEMNGNSRFTTRRQLSPIRIRESISTAGSCQSSSPSVSTFEDSSLLEDSISSCLSTESSTISHDEDSFVNFQSSSSSSADSSHASLFHANFTAHLHVTGHLPDQVPIFLTVSDLRNQSTFMSRSTPCTSPNAEKINKCDTDPEKLKKLQESLLAEDSEEEGDQCRICQIAGGSITNPLLEPCGCGGSLRFVHQECLKTWLKAKIKSGAELGAVKTCELCKQSLTVDLDDFNVNDYYRNHQQSRAEDLLMNSGLYLVLLLHLYEQRFAELMRLNYNQATRARLSRENRTEENQNSANAGNSG